MIASLLLAAPVATALLVAASLRLQSIVSIVLAAYLAFVANLALATWILSPLRGVDRIGLAVVEGLFLAAALVTWQLRGRPRPALRPVLAAAREVAADPVTCVFLAVVGVLLAYELLLVLTAPANNWDALTYHLSRAVAWMQHGGIYRIPNASTPRMNDYQPLAEQQILYFFVATKSGALSALPQYLAQSAILVAVYGASRRLGFARNAAVASSLLLATFSLQALEATTAANDVVAASFPVVALCLLLGGGRLEPALAGAALGIGLGAKLTTLLVLPVLLVLALMRGRRVTGWAAAGGVLGFVAVGMWGFVINLANTGHILGYLGTHVSPAPGEEPLHPSSYATTIDVLYQTFDLSLFSDRVIHLLWIAGIVAGAGVAVFAIRRRGRLRAGLAGVAVAVPFFSPVLMVHAGDGVAALARDWGFPVRGPGGNVGPLARDENSAAFGPVAAVVFLAVPFVALGAFAVRRIGLPQLVLAASVPLVYVLLGHETYDYYMTRFLLVPAALVAPLFALFLSNRVAAAAFLAVAAASVGMIVTQNKLIPLDGRDGSGRPWQLSQVQAAYLTNVPGVGAAVAAYKRDVPEHACVGALIGGNEPAYFLAGPRLEHRVVYLPAENTVVGAYRRSIYYAVISPAGNAAVLASFRQAGWSMRSLGGYWRLAVAPHASGVAGCS